MVGKQRFTDILHLIPAALSTRRCRAKLALALAAGVCGFLVNGFRYEILNNVALIFGGVFYLLVARFCGPYYAFLAALAASSRTLADGGPPWPFVVFSLEGLVTGWLIRRGRILWIADLLFWVCGAVPLLLGLAAMTASQPIRWAWILKLPANGLLNVALVEMLLLLVPVERWMASLTDPAPARPFRSLLFSTFILVVTLPLAFVNVVDAQRDAAQRQREAAEQLQQLAVAVEDAAGQYIGMHRDAIAALAETIRSPNDLSPAALAKRLEQTHAIYGGFLTMLATDERGAVLASHPTTAFDGTPLEARRSVSDREYFRVPLATGRSFVSEVFRGRHFGRHPIVAVSAPLRRANGQYAGVVEGSLDLERLERMVESQRAGPQEIILMDRRNRVVSASSSSGYEVLGDMTSSPLLPFAAQAHGSAPFQYRAGGKQYLAFERSLPSGWRVIVQLPLSIIVRHLRSDYGFTVAWAAAALALGLLLAHRSSRRMTQPLEEVAAGIQGYTPGEAHNSPAIPSYAPSEVKDLAAGFEHMAGRLSASYFELRKANDQADAANRRLEAALANLEQEVNDRTASLAVANSLLTALVESSPIAIVVVAPDSTVRQWNPAAERIFGWTRTEVLDAGLPAGFGGGSRDFRSWCPAVWGGETFVGHEVRWARKSGGLIDVSVCLAPLRGSGKTVSAILVLALDITESKHARDELQRENAFRASIVENSWDGICVCHEIPAPLQLRFTVWNRRMAEITGYTMEQINRLGWYQTAYADPERRARARERIQRVQSGDDLRAEEAEITRSDGSKRQLLISARKLPSHDREPADMLVVLLDITERRRSADERARLRERLHHVQRLESVGRLAGGIAHDFNNLLTIINGYSSLLVNQMAPQDPERQKIEWIQQAGERASRLTDQLLAFGRKQIVRPKLFDLNQVLADHDGMLRRILGDEIELVTAPDPCPAQVFADPGQVHQVLVNLCVNARDAMPQGGSVLIETRNVEMAGTEDQGNPDVHAGHFVLLSVTDTGIGMDEETRRRVFEPFFTTKGLASGSGLGLSTSYGIVAQSGGWISVRSRPGEGSRFEVYLPRFDSGPEETRDREDSERARRGPETVLVAEDEEGVRGFTTLVLKANGYTVIAAPDGKAALAASQAHPGDIDVLVTDVVMPGMGGPDLVSQLKQARPQIRVLYVSGYPEDLIDQRDRLEPGVAFLAKPFTSAGLLESLRKLS